MNNTRAQNGARLNFRVDAHTDVRDSVRGVVEYDTPDCRVIIISRPKCFCLVHSTSVESLFSMTFLIGGTQQARGRGATGENARIPRRRRRPGRPPGAPRRSWTSRQGAAPWNAMKAVLKAPGSSA